MSRTRASPMLEALSHMSLAETVALSAIIATLLALLWRKTQ